MPSLAPSCHLLALLPLLLAGCPTYMPPPEASLPLGASIHVLGPAREGAVGEPLFNDRTRHFVYQRSEPGGKTWVLAAIDGSSRVIAPCASGDELGGWATDGSALAILGRAVGQDGWTASFRVVPVAAGAGWSATRSEAASRAYSGLALLPGAASVSYLVQDLTPPGPMTPMTPERKALLPVTLTWRDAGQVGPLGAMEAPGVGSWDTTGRFYAFWRHRARSLSQGAELCVLASASTSVRAFLDLDLHPPATEFPYLGGGTLSTFPPPTWGPGGRIQVLRAYQEAELATFEATFVAPEGGAPETQVLKITLAPGEVLSRALLSPDGQAVLYERYRRTEVLARGESRIKVSVDQSQGIVWAPLDGSARQQVAPGGHLESWLAGGRDCVVRTGTGTEPRTYYRVDVPVVGGS